MSPGTDVSFFHYSEISTVRIRVNRASKYSSLSCQEISNDISFVKVVLLKQKRQAKTFLFNSSFLVSQKRNLSLLAWNLV